MIDKMPLLPGAQGSRHPHMTFLRYLAAEEYQAKRGPRNASATAVVDLTAVETPELRVVTTPDEPAPVTRNRWWWAAAFRRRVPSAH